MKTVMEQKTIVDIIMKSKASSFHCEVSDFQSETNKVLIANSGDPFFRMISFGSNAVVSVNEKFHHWCSEWFGNVEGIFCFDAPKLVEIGLAMQPYNYVVGEIYDCFLPLCSNSLEATNVSGFNFALREGEEVENLYRIGDFENALTPDNPPDTRYAYVATRNGELYGVAGASKSSNGLWYVGVDVLSPARGKGIASWLIHLLTLHLQETGVTAIYPTWYSNIASRRTALNAGYRPVWVEISSEPMKRNKTSEANATSTAGTVNSS